MQDKYADVFEDKLGTFKSAKVKLPFKEDSQAHFCKASAVPCALRPTVEEELRRLQNEGILTNVEWSDWATPIVPVPKRDGSFRICGDYKGTVNPEQQAEQYPLPRIEDIFAKLARAELLKDWPSSGILQTRDGGRFQEIPHYQHAHGVCFSTTDLVFGITSAPSIWQRTIGQVLEGTSGTSWQG